MTSRAGLLVSLLFLFEGVPSSFGCFEKAVGFFYCGTPWVFHITMLHLFKIAVYLLGYIIIT